MENTESPGKRLKKKNATHAAVAFEEVESEEVNPIAEAIWLMVRRKKVWIERERSWNNREERGRILERGGQLVSACIGWDRKEKGRHTA